MLFNSQDDYALCVKCGKCRSVCPVFRELREEGASPRGKIALAEALLEKGITPSKRTKRFVSECLLCTACVHVCPNNVPTDLLVLSARHSLAAKPGLTVTETGLTKIGFSRTEISFRLAALAEKAAGSRIVSDSGIFYRMPAHHIIPEIKKKPFLRSRRQTAGSRTPAGFFLGCLINFIYHDVADDAVKLMNAAGIEAYIPEHQECCGLPALSMGDTDRALRQAKAVISLFEDVDTVVTACASCGSMMKNYYPLLFKESPDAHRASAFSRKIRDVTEIVDPECLREPVRDRTAVTYHDPCHLKRGMGIAQRPRMLIRKAGYSIREMDEPDRCCGLGGSFHIKHRALSSAITKKKTQSVRTAGAATVATGCPGCMANIAGMLIDEGMKIKVVHTVSLLAAALSPENTAKKDGDKSKGGKKHV